MSSPPDKGTLSSKPVASLAHPGFYLTSGPVMPNFSPATGCGSIQKLPAVLMTVVFLLQRQVLLVNISPRLCYSVA